jgi:hypothetical protein
MKKSYIPNVVAVSILLLVFTSLASAQATRTWVSGVGDDVNPCSRTAPCKTFAGAISKTAAKGEINCLDPGGFGAVTITKAITIDCAGTNGSILASGTNGVIINVTAAGVDAVTIRNISINGAGTGLNGIRVLAGENVHIENVTIFGFLGGTGMGIDVSASATTKLSVVNTTITDNLIGIRATTTSGGVLGDFNDLRIWSNASAGIQGGNGSFLTIRNSNIALNGVGVEQTAAGSSVDLIGNQVNNHATAVRSIGGSTIRIAGNTFAQNALAVNQNGGTINSDGKNNTLGNGVNGTVGAATTVL